MMVIPLCNLYDELLLCFSGRKIFFVINVYHVFSFLKVYFVMDTCVAKEKNYVRLAMRKTYRSSFSFGVPVPRLPL